MFLVTTTIHAPTKPIFQLCNLVKRNNWKFLIIGDRKTPHELYQKLVNENVEYLTPEFQEREYKKLSDSIPFNSIQRRNIGFVHGYKHTDFEVAVTLDDDGLLLDEENYGKNCLVGQEVLVDIFENTRVPLFDPFSVTSVKNSWQRGYVIEYVRHRHEVDYKGKEKRKVWIENQGVSGNLDQDAISRLIQNPIGKFDKFDPYSSNQVTFANSQNTFLHRDILRYYSCWPFVKRLDDLWGMGYLQNKLGIRPVFTDASIFQERNEQDLVLNLENEILGLRWGKRFFESGCDPMVLPMGKEIVEYLKVYEDSF